MEKYREKLKMDNRITGVCALVLAAFAVLVSLAEAGFLTIAPIAGDSHWQSMWRGFCCGLCFGILAVMIFSMVRNRKAMKDDAALKKLYIKEHDERSIQIRISAQAASQQIFLWAGMVAVVISGYFSTIVSITVLICIFFVSIVSLLSIAYYQKIN